VIGCCAGVLCGCPVDEEVMSSLSPLFACAIFYLFILSQHERCVNWDIDENRDFESCVSSRLWRASMRKKVTFEMHCDEKEAKTSILTVFRKVSF
jgi:hypothetical protein